MLAGSRLGLYWIYWICEYFDKTIPMLMFCTLPGFAIPNQRANISTHKRQASSTCFPKTRTASLTVNAHWHSRGPYAQIEPICAKGQAIQEGLPYASHYKSTSSEQLLSPHGFSHSSKSSLTFVAEGALKLRALLYCIINKDEGIANTAHLLC